MKHDLRGFLDGKQLFSFIRWFESNNSRETGIECISREVREELAEIGVDIQPPLLTSRDISKVREVFEGPKPVPNFAYKQFHIFEFYELGESSDALKLSEHLESISAVSDKIVFATAEEIFSGRLAAQKRLRGSAIGHHAEFLLRSYSQRSELPPLAV